VDNLIIVVILAVLLFVGIRSTMKHFKGESSCCGGGSTVKRKKKKLKSVVVKKTMLVEGMTCKNCKARVEWVLNEMDGVSAVVKLSKKTVYISLEKDVADEQISAVIEKAGYKVVRID